MGTWSGLCGLKVCELSLRRLLSLDNIDGVLIWNGDLCHAKYFYKVIQFGCGLRYFTWVLWQPGAQQQRENFLGCHESGSSYHVFFSLCPRFLIRAPPYQLNPFAANECMDGVNGVYDEWRSSRPHTMAQKKLYLRGGCVFGFDPNNSTITLKHNACFFNSSASVPVISDFS